MEMEGLWRVRGWDQGLQGGEAPQGVRATWRQRLFIQGVRQEPQFGGVWGGHGSPPVE